MVISPSTKFQSFISKTLFQCFVPCVSTSRFDHIKTLPWLFHLIWHVHVVFSHLRCWNLGSAKPEKSSHSKSSVWVEKCIKLALFFLDLSMSMDSWSWCLKGIGKICIQHNVLPLISLWSYECSLSNLFLLTINLIPGTWKNEIKLVLCKEIL